MRRAIALGVLGVLTVAVLGLLGWVAYSRVAFGTWDPTARPSRIDYCDRRYYPGSHFSRAQIEAAGNGFGLLPFRQVGMTASGAPIFARPLADCVRQRYPNSAPLPCAMSVYLKIGADDYLDYGISGGP